MTGFSFSDTPDDGRIRATGHDLLPSTFSETLGAVAQDPTLSPIRLSVTGVRIAIERGTLLQQFMEALPGGGGLTVARETGVFDPGLRMPETRLSAFLTAEDANKRFGDLGLKFKKPVRAGVASILAEQKREEIARRDIIERGPQGFFAKAAQFGVGFLAAAVDPVNVSAAFIPGVGEARLAAIGARLGVNFARGSAGRVAVGAAEGALGNAALEPFVFLLARDQQLDYTLLDAFVNVAFGGLIGGGVHTISAAARRLRGRGRPETARVEPADAAIGRLAPEVQQESLEVAIRQAVLGKNIDVEPSLRGDLMGTVSARGLEAGGDIDIRGLDIDTGRAPDVATPRLREMSEAERTALADDIAVEMRRRSKEVAAAEDAPSARKEVEARKAAQKQDERRRALSEKHNLGDGGEDMIADAIAVQNVTRITQNTPLRSLKERVRRQIDSDSEVELRRATAAAGPDTARAPQDAEDFARRQALPDSDGGIDIEAARQADVELADAVALGADIDSIENDLRALPLTKSQQKVIDDAGKLVEDAEKMRTVVRAAAQCQT